jgi:hypothetical protein
MLAQEAADTYRGYQALFGQAAETFPGLDAVAAQVAERADVWRALLALQQHALDWTSGTVLAEDGTVRPPCLMGGGQICRRTPSARRVLPAAVAALGVWSHLPWAGRCRLVQQRPCSSVVDRVGLSPALRRRAGQARLDMEAVRGQVEAAAAAAYRCSRSGGDPGVVVRPARAEAGADAVIPAHHGCAGAPCAGALACSQLGSMRHG